MHMNSLKSRLILAAMATALAGVPVAAVAERVDQQTIQVAQQNVKTLNAFGPGGSTMGMIAYTDEIPKE
jgi:hypothetical protein